MLEVAQGFFHKLRAAEMCAQLLLFAFFADVELCLHSRGGSLRLIILKALDAATPCTWFKNVRVDLIGHGTFASCRYESFPCLLLLTYTTFPLLVHQSWLAQLPIRLDRIPSCFELILRYFASEHFEE